MAIFEHDSCLKCGADTNHFTGICKQCRVKECPTCGKVYLANQKSMLMCSVCSGKQRRKKRTWSCASL